MGIIEIGLFVEEFMFVFLYDYYDVWFIEDWCFI